MQASDSFFDHNLVKGGVNESFKLWTKSFPPLELSDVKCEGFLFLHGAQTTGPQKAGYYHLTPSFLYYSKVILHFPFNNAE